MKNNLLIFKQNWIFCFQIAIWLSNLIITFVITPTLSSNEKQASTLGLTKFVITIFLILVVILGRFYSDKKYLVYWLSSFLIFTVFAIFEDQNYDEINTECTCKYFSKTIIIGNELKEAKDVNINCEELIINAGGIAEDIWTPKSIQKCDNKIKHTFTILVSLFSASIICILQALYTTELYFKKKKVKERKKETLKQTT